MIWFILVLLSLAIASFTENGFKIWCLCLFLCFAFSRCQNDDLEETNKKEQKKAQMLYELGMDICNKSDYPYVFVVKKFNSDVRGTEVTLEKDGSFNIWPGDDYFDYMFICVDSQGNTHIPLKKQAQTEAKEQENAPAVSPATSATETDQ